MELLARAKEGIGHCRAGTEAKDLACQNLETWLSQPEFAAYKPQIQWLIETEQWSGLLDRFYQILPFGTGGRRGAVGVGPNRMNLWTLGASVQGHCEYLKERFPGVNPLRVMVAYDVRQFEDNRRNYNPNLPNPVLHLTSRDFAKHAVEVYAANGIHSYILPETSTRFLATPELSFGIRQLNCHGGLNISASHNPPDDNGGKFYDERGAQPVPPEDQIMAELVDHVQTIRTLPWSEAVRSGKVHFLDDSLHKAYLALCRGQSLVQPPRFDEIRVVFTPLHGVGGMTALEVLTDQGFRAKTVESQMTPDGQFPNVTKSPNPEVPASMDKAEELAREIQADLVLSTDPDADRLGGMVPWEDDSQINWKFLTGNEICALLTHFKLRKMTEEDTLPSSPIVIKTLVTTSLVTRIARHFGSQIVDNLLVGCKYIGDVLWQLERQGAFEDVSGSPEDFVIGVEESHGILLTPEIRDKDAGPSALLLAELALDCKRQGSTLFDYLESLYHQFGYHCTSLHPMKMPGLEGKEKLDEMLDLLRQSPFEEIAGSPVTRFVDLRSEDCWLGPLKGKTDWAARNFLLFEMGDSARIALRPSGTEPKAKAYVEVCTDPRSSNCLEEDWQTLCRETRNRAQDIARDFLARAFALVGMEPPRAD